MTAGNNIIRRPPVFVPLAPTPRAPPVAPVRAAPAEQRRECSVLAQQARQRRACCTAASCAIFRSCCSYRREMTLRVSSCFAGSCASCAASAAVARSTKSPSATDLSVCGSRSSSAAWHAATVSGISRRSCTPQRVSSAQGFRARPRARALSSALFSDADVLSALRNTERANTSTCRAGTCAARRAQRPAPRCVVRAASRACDRSIAPLQHR